MKLLNGAARRGSPGLAALLLASVILLPGWGRCSPAAAEGKASMPRSATEDPAAEPVKPAPYTLALEHYRANRIREAAGILEETLESNEGNAGHRSLLGWCLLRLDRPADAAEQFRQVLNENAGSHEARHGLATALVRTGRAEEALDIAMALLREKAGDEDALRVARHALASAGKIEDRRLRPPEPPARLNAPPLLTRAGEDYLEVRAGDRFIPIFIKGVNLGVALPGRFPAEFPQEKEIYATWLGQIAGMGINVVRVYTLLPPVFYQALHEHNRKLLDEAGVEPGEWEAPPPGFLWLVHGVWTELPEEDRYDDPAFAGAFRKETERILDALHGNIAVGYRPGHAFGLYRHDVSRMTLAMILGREWEPYSVLGYNRKATRRSFRGRYFRVLDGTPMEAWVASTMEQAVAYEMSRFGFTRPIAFTNWPTLDPLHHPTESTIAEESVLRVEQGLPPHRITGLEHDEDAVSVDPSRIEATSDARAGHFASYHAYPYYPDFMNLDPGYSQARDHLGPNNYIGYLRELREHHRGIPLLISEIGVPTSRGNAHLQPQGFHHGGHNEQAQGEINARLMESIHAAGCGGGILFAWMDEWFKRNWQVEEFELPFDRNPKWHNPLDPEQYYGILAADPGRTGPRIILDGSGEDWTAEDLLIGREPDLGEEDPGAPRLRGLWAAADEAYLFLRLDLGEADQDSDGLIDWDRIEVLIGIDTYDTEAGDRVFPDAGGLRAPTGMEFMVRLAGQESRVLVDPPYDLLTHHHRRPYRSLPNEDGLFMPIRVRPNPPRIGRDGTSYPEIYVDQSPLKTGINDPNAPEFDSLADWNSDGTTGIIEIRLPWGLLNVTDPSSRHVLHEERESEVIGIVETEGFRLYAVLLDKASGAVADTLPAREGECCLSGTVPALYAWPRWEEPTFHTRLKRSYSILRERLAPLTARETP